MPSTTQQRRALSPILVFTSILLNLISLANGFSFNINNTPEQCQNLSISITGSGGTPPYHVLIVPFGQTPLSNNVEARSILDVPFDGSSTSVSFQLKYPALSQFVAVVSDNVNFGSGGTSSVATVVKSSDSSCFSSTQSVNADFVFNTFPINQIVQCTPSRLWWTPSDVQGQVRFYGIIPGGNSFNITVPSQTTQQPDKGTGFDWVPDVRGGTTFLIGAGDDRGLGAGGSVTYIVSQSTNSSCLDNSSPSSTAGSPAGGNYPTSTAEAENSGGSKSSSSNTGAIAGGVVAGVVAILAFILALIFLRRRKRKSAAMKERPDLFTDNERPNDARAAEMEHLAPPEPYYVPDQPSSSEYGGASSSGVPDSAYGYGIGTGTGAAARYANRQSQHSLMTSTEGGEQGRPITPSTSAGMSTAASRKGGLPSLRPVNIIQHEDAGPPAGQEASGEAETVELPPAYTNIRQ